MKPFIPVFLIFLLILCYGKLDNQYPYTDYFPNGKGLVRFHFVNVTDTSNYTCWYNTQLPSGQSVERFCINSDSLIEFEVKATKPTINYLHENSPAQFMVLPNDTIEIFIDRKKVSSLAEIISFKGKTAIISEYLTQAKMWLYDYFPAKEELPENYNSRIDSASISALGKLDDFNDNYKLPEWFIEYEKMDIVSHCEKLKQMQYNQRYWKYNQFVENNTVQASKIKEKEIKINRGIWISHI